MSRDRLSLSHQSRRLQRRRETKRSQEPGKQMGLRGPEERGRFLGQHGVLGTNLFLPLAEGACPASRPSSCFCACEEEASVSPAGAGVSLGPLVLLRRRWTCPERPPRLLAVGYTEGRGDISTVAGLGVAGWCLRTPVGRCEFSSVVLRPSWPRLLRAGPLRSGSPRVRVRVREHV